MTTSGSTSTPKNDPATDQRGALITQLYAGPSFRETAATMLRQSLQALYPTLDIDPNIALLGTPTWELAGEHIIAGPPTYQALSDILAKQAVLAVPTLCIEGEHFLTQQPFPEPAIHLPVRITDIAQTINVLAPVMLRAYQQEHIAYWNQSNGNGPRWHELSGALRAVWNVQQTDDWSVRDCAMARTLFSNPDPADREQNAQYPIKAYLIDIDVVDTGQEDHLNDVVMAVLVGEDNKQSVILTYSLLKGYEKFTSLQKLGESLPAHLSPSLSNKQIQWRLYEPKGNYFDQMACALVSLQIEAIGQMDFSDLRQANTVDIALGTPPEIDAHASKNGPDPAWYQARLPQWLHGASTSDLDFYARHLKDLAALHRQHNGQSWQDGVPDIEQYALTTLRAQLIKDHPDGATLALENLRIQVQSPVIWGTFIVPGKTDITTFSLAQLALQNLIALPTGNKTLQWSNGRNLPEWMTVSYLETLIAQADIGSAYPALIKTKLRGDAQESTRRKTLYTQQLQTQLPLLALQCKIRGQAGIDERGYRYVVAAMKTEPNDRQVDGQTIVIRPLAFCPKRRTDTALDTVVNMYVIGPQEMAAGPCLLYRPLFDPPLAQYPSPANLIYAIAQSASLRDSVLAWLPDAARQEYASYVFPPSLPSPWAVTEFLIDPDKLWVMSGPLALGEQVLNGDRFTTLFNANVDALIELADRQSVSNAESRWATLKNAGWTLFSAALPFIGRTANTAAWIWQVLDQVQAFVQAKEQDDQPAEWSALADVLLNLGMAITLHIASRSHRVDYPRAKTARITKASVPQDVIIKKLPTVHFELPPKHHPPIHISGAINRKPSDLAILLDSFKVDKPQELGTAETATGPYQHLYRQGQKNYVAVGQRWFEVTADDDGTVLIIDPKEPTRTGPVLIHNARGQWFIDSRLHLRGGGPKRMMVKSKSDADIKASATMRKLSSFEKEKRAAQHRLQQARLSLTDTAPGTSAEANRQRYLDTLETQRKDYETALQALKTLQVLAPVADYQQRALGYVNAQVKLTEAGISEAKTHFTPQLETVLKQIEHQATHPQERQVEDAQKMTTLNQDMIQRLEYMQGRFNELGQLGEPGAELIRNTKKELPAYSLLHLQALQVTLARNLCVLKSSMTTDAGAWAAIDRIVDSADLSIQALRETLFERSEARLDERIETLASLVEQFHVIDERLQDFPDEFPVTALKASIDALRKQIRGLYRQTLQQLAMLHDQREALRSRPTPPPTPPAPQKKIIHTRYNGVLVGNPRLSQSGADKGLVDIVSPLTEKVIATFHEKNSGVWVQRITPASLAAVTPDLTALLVQSQALLDGLPEFKRRVTELADKPQRSAVGIESLYHQHALKLEDANSAIELALTQSSVTNTQKGSAATLTKNLKDEAQTLYRQANVQMRRMITLSPPTIRGLEWLKSRNEITIKKHLNRRKLKGVTPDYLDEYTIKDQQTHEVLWYAHFHYSTDWTPARAFLSARLKTPQEQARGEAADTPNELNEQQRADFYRSEISLEQARKLFFNLK